MQYINDYVALLFLLILSDLSAPVTADLLIRAVEGFLTICSADSELCGLWKLYSHFCQMCVVLTPADPTGTSMNFSPLPKKLSKQQWRPNSP